MSLTVIPIGVGDTFSAHLHTCSVVVQLDDFRLAIDCPDRYRGALAAASKTLESAGHKAISLWNLDHVLITHVHGDHMNGLEGVAFFKHFAQNQRLSLITSQEVRDVIWDKRLEVAMGQLWDGEGFVEKHFEDYFDFSPLRWDAAIEVGPLTIRARKTIHHVPTSALLIEGGGRTLGYSADTAFDPELIEWLDEADLIIHETNHGPAHTAYEDLAALPQRLRDKMMLIHYSDRFDQSASVIELAKEGVPILV